MLVQKNAEMRTRIKICCMASLEEAMMAIHHGADAIGLVGRMPSGPGPISDELIRHIALSVPPPIATFLLTSETSVNRIVRHHERVHTNAIQLVDSLKEGSYHDLHKAMPSVKIIQVIHVTGEEAVEEAIRIAPHVDALLLDSGNPTLPVKELGGTGRIHDWKISRKICEQVKVPVFLAGGLNAGNVRKAIEEVNPFGVDVCSGVRTGGKLDGGKLTNFIKQVQS
jgi:phosphoribosylanthranilate isomerase